MMRNLILIKLINVRFRNRKCEILVLIIVGLSLFFYPSIKKQIIIKEYIKAEGKLINYNYDDGWNGFRSLTYEFLYNGKRYRHSINPKSYKYDYCNKTVTFRLCSFVTESRIRLTSAL